MKTERVFESDDVRGRLLDGRYQLKRPIARVTSGGFVYAAEHIFTRKPCAVKMLDAGAPQAVTKRMRREMDALAAVQGEGVVDFRDAGELEGRLYLVLELLEGRTLGGLLAAKRTLTIEQSVKVGCDIADGLARCHERGVVHRDVKPANVFITTSESVQLLDFGIAKIVDRERSAAHEKLTQENSLVGTPEYMAPEALLASPDVDERADQYGLGVVLYECLAGVVPFGGAYGDVLRKVSTSSVRPLRELRADVPGVLDDIVSRALRRDPTGRFFSMAAMRDALGDAVRGTAATRIFDHRPVRAQRDAATVADAPIAKERAGTRRRRHARAPYVTLARVRAAGEDHVDGRIEEVSESGFQFVGSRSIADGVSVTVRFALPVSGRITAADATSRWSHSTRGLTAAGFEFANLSDEATAEIRKYVSLMCSD